jgi:hypothetical protein
LTPIDQRVSVADGGVDHGAPRELKQGRQPQITKKVAELEQHHVLLRKRLERVASVDAM